MRDDTERDRGDSLKLEGIPFLWRPLEDPDTNPFPDTLPFELVVMPESGLLSQRPNAAVADVLLASYGKGTHIEGRMDADGIGAEYAGDFLSYIESATVGRGVADKSILEIGCGTGYLLCRLREAGADVLGYEPGYPGIGKYPVEVIPDFFPTDAVSGRTFDLVLAFGLLEHIPDPRTVIDHMVEHVAPDGLLIIGVPDCEEQISHGDLSMLIHEHYSYFTTQSLRSFAEACDLEAISVEKAGFGGMIYGAFRRSTRPRAPGLAMETGGVFDRIATSLQRLEDLLRANTGCSVGFYVPSRAINSLYVLREVVADTAIKLRFFDDSLNLVGRFYPGYAVPVEDRGALIADPPDVLVICTYSFADRIIANLDGELPPTTNVIRLHELLRV